MHMGMWPSIFNWNSKIKCYLSSNIARLVLFSFIFQTASFQTYAFESKESPDVNLTTRTAQLNELSGKITDENGEPLPGASVIVKGTTTGTNSDFDGNYTLSIPSNLNNIILEVAFVGYITQEIKLSNQETLNISLTTDSVGLDEAVVIGYGTQKKSHLIGSITKVDGAAIAEIPVSNVDEALRGRVAGLQVRNTSAEVGEAQEIVIRGASSINANNSPLIVIDGIAIPDMDISAVDSNDIESLEVLKDAASTSIYGSRGASGVIIITTKSGKPGKKTTYTLNLQSGIKSAIYAYDVYSQFESNETKLDRQQQGWETPFFALGLNPGNQFDQAGSPLPNPDGTLYPTMNSYLNGSAAERTKTMIAIESGPHDWTEDLTRDNPTFKKYSLTVRGGTEATNFYVSGSYQDNQGLMKDNNYERLYLRLKLDTQLEKNLRFGVNITPQFISSERSSANFNLGLPYDNFMPVYHNEFTSFLTKNTFSPGEYTRSSHFGNGTPLLSWDEYYAWKDGNLTELPDNLPVARLSSSSATNPIAKQNERDRTNNEFRILSSLYLNWNISDKLLFRTTVSHYFTDRKNKDIQSEYYSRYALRQATNYDRTTSKFINENTLTYQNEFGDHELDLLGGITEEITKYTFSRIEGSNIPMGMPLTLNNATLISQDPSDTFANDEKEVLLSGLFRVNYSFKERYLFSASIRADGSSIFAEGNRWGYFPSISAGWRLNKEQFMQSIDWISNLKLRASFGVTGNNSIARYSYLDRLISRNYPNDVGGISSGLGLENVTKGNPNITWEKTNQFNYGIDIGLFNNRIGISAEYYYTLTEDLLLQKTMPLSTGFENVWENVGRINNQGLELQLNSVNINHNDFKWKMYFNYAHNKNKLIDFGGQYRMFSYGRRQNEYLMQVGLQPSNMYGWKTDGIFNSIDELNNSPHNVLDIVGSLKRVDIDGDGEITEADKTIIGNPVPKFNWGFGHDFNYKNFDLSVLFEGAHDFDILNSDYYNYTMRDNISDHFEGAYLDEFHGTKPIVVGGVKWEYTDHIVYDASYVALRNVSLGYKFNKGTAQKMKLASLRLYLTGLNVFHHIYGDYSGINPEYKDRNHNSVLKGGEQSFTLPLERSFIFGVDIKF